MPQLSYTRDLVPGLPGMAYSDWNSLQIVSRPAGAVIQPGVAVEVIAGLLYPLKDAGTAGSFLPAMLGVAMRDPAMENSYPPATGTGVVSFAGYQVGQQVPVCRKGTIWVQTDGGGTWPDLAAVRVWHSSTGANPQGVFTMTAAQTTVGAEIDLLGAGVLGSLVSPAGTYTDGFGQTFKVAVLELNLPSVAL